MQLRFSKMYIYHYFFPPKTGHVSSPGETVVLVSSTLIHAACAILARQGHPARWRSCFVSSSRCVTSALAFCNRNQAA